MSHDRSEESFATAPDQTRLYVRRRSGPRAVTAVLSDGLVCDGFIFKYLWDDLARSVSVAHWNYRGHGRSELPRNLDRIGVEHHAADLNAVRTHLSNPPVVLVGHSMGTQVALEAYRQRPEGVVGLVLLCGSFGRVTHTFKGSDLLATAVPKLLEQVTLHPKLSRAIWSRMPTRLAVRMAIMAGEVDAKAINPEDMEPYFQHAAHVDFEIFLKMLRLAGEHTAEDLLPEVRVPALVVAGSNDSFTPPALSEAMAEQMPLGDLLMIRGGTHVAPLEHHEFLARRLEEFLASIEVQ